MGEMLDKKDRLLILMSYCEISNKKQEELLVNLEDFSVENMLKIADKFFSVEEVKRLKDFYNNTKLDSLIENMEKSGIEILTIFSKEYPSSLIDLPERPLVLYAKGDLSLLNQKCFAIVGTRMPSGYGRVVTEKFAKELAESGFVIVSGLCHGVDTISHKGALDVGGKTIAIIGSGFNRIYPSINNNLAKEIAEKGLLLSEYPPSFEAKRYTFPRRNRIIAGVSSGVLITEAGKKSGTLHTKEYALLYGKDIFAVPGNINSSKSELTNFLIKTAQAECVLSPQDIIEFYGLSAKAKENRVLTLSFDEQAVVKILEEGESTFDEIAEKSKISVNILNSCLTTLEIRGLIRKLPSQTYVLI